MSIIDKVGYGIAVLFILVSAIAGYQSGIFSTLTYETVFYVCGAIGLLILLALANKRSASISVNYVFTRLLLGVGALGVSLYYSYLFITQGTSGIALAIGVVFVIVTESAKILFLNDATYHAAIGNHEKSLWLFVIVLILFALSIAATMYFLISAASVDHSAAMQSENRYQILQNQYSDIDAQIAAARADKGKCPSNYITNCIKPAQAKIDALLQQKQSVGEQVGNYKPTSGGAVFWQRVAETTGIAASKLETGFSFVRGLLLEILGLILIAQASTATRLKHGSKDNAHTQHMQAAQAVPSLDVGGRIYGDGLAIVHSGETVLNAGATTELDKTYPGLLDTLNLHHAQRAQMSVHNPVQIRTKAGGTGLGQQSQLGRTGGRPANGQGDHACIAAALSAAMLDGSLPKNAGRDKARKYLSSVGYTCSNETLGNILKQIRQEMKS